LNESNVRTNTHTDTEKHTKTDAHTDRNNKHREDKCDCNLNQSTYFSKINKHQIKTEKVQR